MILIGYHEERLLQFETQRRGAIMRWRPYVTRQNQFKFLFALGEDQSCFSRDSAAAASCDEHQNASTFDDGVEMKQKKTVLSSCSQHSMTKFQR
jgi:hypothetical protein